MEQADTVRCINTAILSVDGAVPLELAQLAEKIYHEEFVDRDRTMLEFCLFMGFMLYRLGEYLDRGREQLAQEKRGKVN